MSCLGNHDSSWRDGLENVGLENVVGGDLLESPGSPGLCHQRFGALLFHSSLSLSLSLSLSCLRTAMEPLVSAGAGVGTATSGEKRGIDSIICPCDFFHGEDSCIYIYNILYYSITYYNIRIMTYYTTYSYNN